MARLEPLGLSRRPEMGPKHDHPAAALRPRSFSTAVICASSLGVLIALGIAGYFAVRSQVLSSSYTTLELAEQALRQRDNARVRQLLAWLLWFQPLEERALLLKGVSLNADRQFPEAIEVLEKIPETSDRFETGSIALAASLIMDGQLQRAESVLQRHLQRFPLSREGYERLTKLYLKELRKRSALVLLYDQWNHSPNDLSVLPDLLELQAKPLTARERIEFLEEADRKHPQQPAVTLALATVYAHLGLTDRARTRFQETLTLSPHDPTAKTLAAEFYLDNGEDDRAESLLETISSADAEEFNDERYWFVRCRLADRAGNITEAESYLQKSLALRPTEETYVLMSATLGRRRGRVEEATQAAQRAARLATDRQQLLLLSDKLDRHRPEPALCQSIAERFDSMGETLQAAGWRQIGQTAEQLAKSGPAPPLPERNRDPAGAGHP